MDALVVKRRLSRTVRILSAGAKGGPGKSFIVKNLAAAAADAGFAVGVVDFDLQRTFSKWLHRRMDGYPDSAPICGYEADPRLVSDAMDVSDLNDQDILFIDIPPSVDQHSDMLKTLAYNVDLVIVPTKVGISDTESAEILLGALREWGVPSVVVLNQVKPRARQLKTAKRRLVRYCEVLAIELFDHNDHLSADEAGLGATEIRRCAGSDDIEALWLEIRRRLDLDRLTLSTALELAS